MRVCVGESGRFFERERKKKKEDVCSFFVDVIGEKEIVLYPLNEKK